MGEPANDAIPPRPAGDPFDAWLDRGLRRLYEPVLREAVPQHLLDMIENDQRQADAQKPGAG